MMRRNKKLNTRSFIWKVKAKRSFGVSNNLYIQCLLGNNKQLTCSIVTLSGKGNGCLLTHSALYFAGEHLVILTQKKT